MIGLYPLRWYLIPVSLATLVLPAAAKAAAQYVIPCSNAISVTKDYGLSSSRLTAATYPNATAALLAFRLPKLAPSESVYAVSLQLRPYNSVGQPAVPLHLDLYGYGLESKPLSQLPSAATAYYAGPFDGDTRHPALADDLFTSAIHYGSNDLVDTGASPTSPLTGYVRDVYQIAGDVIEPFSGPSLLAFRLNVDGAPPYAGWEVEFRPPNLNPVFTSTLTLVTAPDPAAPGLAFAVVACLAARRRRILAPATPN